MTNIFSLSPRLGDEDRFTAQLTYLIETIPEIGQELAELLVRGAGCAPPRFVRAVDHPAAAAEDRPDFLLRCEDYDVICEHKLGSALGPRQLERYLALRGERPSFLALITSGICPVPDEVLASDRYLRPRPGPLTHFRWEDLYPIVAGRGERLARDFADYMVSLGLRPLRSESWRDLFSSPERVDVFQAQLASVRAFFVQMGATCRRAPRDPGMEIQHAAPWLPLLYINALQEPKPRTSEIAGPYLRAAVYVRTTDPRRERFRSPAAPLPLGSTGVLSRPSETIAAWNPGLVQAREYLAPLDEILCADAAVLRERLLDFATAAFHDAERIHDDGPPG